MRCTYRALGAGLISCVVSGHSLAATYPLDTDVLPSGVPLQFPSATVETPPLDWSDTLLGDVWGVRKWMNHYGLRLNIQDAEELWGVASGGRKQGASYDGATAISLTFDPTRLTGLKYGLFNISALQLRGRSATTDNIGAINPVSGYDSPRTTRLFELWYGQGFLGNRLDVRVGAMDLDTEFLVSQNASLFLNGSFGWPIAPSSNLYSGGPSWPYSTPGVRFRYNPIYPLTFMAAVSDDNPTGGPFFKPDDSPPGDLSGTHFNTSNGALIIFETQLLVDAGMLLNHSHHALPGTWKIGGFYDTASFPDPRYASNHLPLTAPGASASPLYHTGNWMLYGVFDQTFWRLEKDSPKAASFFIRVTGNDDIRNTLTLGTEAGLTFHGLIPARPDDVLGLAWGTAFYGHRARMAEQDSLRYTGQADSRTQAEQHLELTWQAPVTPYIMVQPDFQYFWNINSGSPDSETGHRIPNAAILGLNVTTTF